MLDALPSEVLLKILRGTNQDTLTQGLFLASKALYAAARDASLWREVWLSELDSSALRFMGETATACERLCIENSCPDDVGLFLEDLAEKHPAVASNITGLVVYICGRCTRLPDHMLEAMCAGFPSLRTLCIRLEGGVEDEGNDLHFPQSTRLGLLEELEIVEMPETDQDGDMEPSNLCVFFGSAGARSMPSLRKITLAVASSDVMLGDVISNLPALRVLSYHSEFESYDQDLIRMDKDIRLDFLGISVHEHSDFSGLLRALANASRVGVLNVRAHTDVTFDVALPVESLCVHVLEPGAIVQFDFFTLKDSPRLKRLGVRCHDMEDDEEEACVKFVSVPSAAEWMKLHADCGMSLSPRARIELSPAHY